MLVTCDECNACVDGIEQGSYEIYDPDEGIPGRFTLLKCPQCTMAILVYQANYGTSNAHWEAPYRLYPAQNRLEHTVPKAVNKAYTFRNELPRDRRVHTGGRHVPAST